MKAFITGITGFAGGFLAEHLLASGDRVLGCSARAAWPAWASRDLTVGVELLHWDLGDAAGPSGEVRDRIAAFAPDCIFHLAALSVPVDCGRDEPTPRAVAVNVEGTTRMLQLAMSLSSRPRVLFTSTSHVYAPVTSPTFEVDETAPLGPRRGYGISKLAAEERIRETVCRAGLDVVIARSFQHTGPRQEPKLMLPEWAQQFARQGSGPVRVKNLNTWIDLSDVRDVVRAYRRLIEWGEAGSVYNVGSGTGRRTGEVLEILANYAGSKRPIEVESHEERRDPIADNRKLVACSHWRPEISLEKTVADTFDYWRALIAALH
ncbi:MAG TPA: NAD-dependent epimerase/dehydratase family protein [Pirellulales bacterium]|nr:NAD-dependent epimerase/dehydratase family protein [Pirellulales bacterium]